MLEITKRESTSSWSLENAWSSTTNTPTVKVPCPHDCPFLRLEHLAKKQKTIIDTLLAPKHFSYSIHSSKSSGNQWTRGSCRSLSIVCVFPDFWKIDSHVGRFRGTVPSRSDFSFSRYAKKRGPTTINKRNSLISFSYRSVNLFNFYHFSVTPRKILKVIRAFIDVFHFFGRLDLLYLPDEKYFVTISVAHKGPTTKSKFEEPRFGLELNNINKWC